MAHHHLQPQITNLDFVGMDANWTLEEQVVDYDNSLDTLFDLAHKLYQYYVPIIACGGIICSLFVVIVLLKSRLRKRYFSHLFAAIAICDIGFLLTILCIWTRDQGLDIYMAPGLCQMVIFASHFFPFLSFWYSICGCIVLVLRGRCYDMSITMFNGPGKARLLVISLCIFAITIFVYKTWTNGVLIVMGTRICTVLPENEPAMRILNVFDMVLLLVLPFTLFLVFDFWILTHVVLRCFQGANSMSHRPVVDRSFKILFIHSILFLLFVGPGCVSKLIIIVKVLTNVHFYTFQAIIIENVLQYFFYSYFSFKSILHIIVSKSFRCHAWKLLSKLRKSARMSNVLSPTSRDHTFV